MKKWITSAILYLVIIIAVYHIYGLIESTNQEASENTSDHASHEHGAGEDDSHGAHHSGDSDVKAEVRVSGKGLNIYLIDKSGNPVEELEVNHEKLLHLIIVDEHLDQYLHLHPDQIDVGVFQTNQQLPDGNYTAFVDIIPTGQSYSVEPIRFTIGEDEAHHAHDSLEPDKELTKVVNKQEATLEMSSTKAGEPVTLEFSLPGADLEPYLGAMGHVVILDENAENYLHVHPTNYEETTFETTFDQPGIYKIWAEFQIAGEVLVFPYIVEIH
ncbi:hypothetical protein [Bacillus sp. PS06]|uniref:hypothetical protein n=1 Tax=Bacillus sp. PS06 TaxID=2764176 RepID=UPI00177F0D1E|nr:hypothetical protein [Bacillus sp. PS06]MBD8071497.1 hypothetical protein [Bacillus sp. PS06]